MDGIQERIKSSPAGGVTDYFPAEGSEGSGPEYLESGIGGRVRREGEWLIATVRERGRRVFKNEMESLAMVADELAAAFEHSSRVSIDNDSPAISRYCDLSAAGLEQLAAGLRSLDLETVISRAGKFAQAHPVLFLSGTMAAGFAAARVLNSSSLRPAAAGW